MGAVQRQIRTLEGQTGVSVAEQDAQSRPDSHFVKRVLSILDQIPAPSSQRNHALPDEIADPLKDLGAGAQDYGSAKQPELFTITPRGLAAEPAKPATRESKLARYLDAGRIESSIPIRRVKRQTRNLFWMWLGLGLAVVLVLRMVLRS